MTRPLLFSAFVMNTASHILHGLWRRPDARQIDFDSLDLWIDLARTVERGNFDLLFFADVAGLYDEFQRSHHKFIESGLQIPSNDPAVLLSALASHTEHLGLAITSNILQEHPFQFSRKMSTLDHASKGRIAWNIVTNIQRNGARNFGQELTEHDERYEWADEYVTVAYKLWEGSWDEGALLRNRDTGVFADVDRVHKIHHEGKRYRVEGPHLVAPSPQRTPVLFQAGSSEAGMRFAARHAEAQFLVAPRPEVAGDVIRSTRALMAESGRRPEDLLVFQGLTFAVGSTEEEVRRVDRQLDEEIDTEAMIAHLSGAAGVDFTGHTMDTPLREITTEGSRGILHMVRAAVVDREPTVRDIGVLAGRASRVSGTPEQIADALEAWQRVGVDGVNVMNATIPGTYTEFIDHVMPVLQRRGLARRDPPSGTLRHQLFGRDRLPDTHPAARFRNAF